MNKRMRQELVQKQALGKSVGRSVTEVLRSGYGVLLVVWVVARGMGCCSGYGGVLRGVWRCVCCSGCSYIYISI